MVLLKKLAVLLFTIVECTATIAASTGQAPSFITIGTGGMTGIYYPAGGAICQLVNKHYLTHGIRCSIESTGGSIYNLNTLRRGELDLGIVQSDWQFHAYRGTGTFAPAGGNTALRAVFSLHAEAFTVVARRDAGIKQFTDLQGKRVNIGNPGSGHRATLEQLLAMYGWTHQSFALASELKPAEMAKALCDKKIDAFVYTVGHPSGAIKEAVALCDAVLVPVAGEPVQRLMKQHLYYHTTTIPAGLYHDGHPAVPTFGVAATLVTSTQVSANTVYQVTRSVFAQLADFKRQLHVFSTLEPANMVHQGLTIPLHDGAKRYYQEAGLLQ